MDWKERDIAVRKAEAILRSYGIEMKVGACGCCRSPWITFKHKGEVILDDAEFDGEGLDTERGGGKD